MAENEEVIKFSPQQRSSFSETEHTERRRPGPKSRKARIPPRRPTQRHCPKTNNRKSITKRRKRLLSASDPSNQEPESPKVSDSSLSQTSTSSSLSPVSPLPSNSTGKKRRYAIDKCDGRGETHLHKAAIKGDIKKVKHLLRRGANPNHQDFAGWTPLHEACIRGWYHVAQALLKAGADVNTPGLHNVTALHDATAWSHLSLVKLLLKYGAKINAKTDKGDTPVEVASAVVLDYLESHGLIPESAKARAVPERTYEMRKSTYRSKVVKADSADVKFKIKVRCEQTGEDRDAIKPNKKSKKKPASLNHSKAKMESDEAKKESAASAAPDVKETTETKSSSALSGSASSSAAAEGSEAASSTTATSSATATETVSETESRRSSISLDDEDEGKRIKRRKEKDEHTRKEDTRAKEDHKKDEHASKKEEHTHKKEEHNTAGKSKSSSTNSASPKSTTSLDGQDGEDCSKSVGSPGPKVPPLKIVIPPVETEQGSRNGKNTGRHHPYVVVSNEETGTASSTVTTSPSSPAVPPPMIKEEPPSPMSSNTLSNDEQRIQQRVLRSTHSSNRITTGNNNSSTNSTSSGSNSSTTSGNSSPAAPDLSPQTDMTTPSKEETKAVKIEPGIKGSKSVDSSGKSKVEPTIKMEPADEESTAKASSSETRSAVSYHKEDASTVELHPRKRKLKSKQESTHMEVDNVPSFSSAPHPHEVPVTNCYQMYMDIRKQIDVKRKGLFPIQPKPPQGFKDYLMNRCTYTLAGNTVGRAKRRSADPPDSIPEGLKELYKEQEAERQKMRMQHIVEKEKLVLSVEQEILRVHGRAARALANQALPFSACTILKDEEVYNVITPEQEEKDRNARSRYNGRLFISWLQDVDDKWEKIKEEMLARHHKEAESLNAIQKFKWDLRMRILGLCKSRSFAVVDEISVPMIKVSDDFDLLPE